jgi:hypothetical protein
MGLVRDREQFEFERFDGVYFWMREDADQILCKVSHKALRDRNAHDGGDADLAATFVRHRGYTATIRPLLAAPVIIHFWTVIAWNKVLSSATPNLARPERDQERRVRRSISIA